MGGDGTLSEVAHGLLTSGPLPPGFSLTHLPAGSGCDFARHFCLPTKPEDWPGLIRNGRVSLIDAGKVSWSEPDGPKERYFVNIAMAGLAGDIVHTMERTGKPLGGLLSYLGVSLAHICRSRAKPLELSFDGQSQPMKNYHLLALANTAMTGGGMRIAPQADAKDGLFDFIGVGPMNRARLLMNFPKIYKGSHLQVDGIKSGRMRRLDASSSEPVRLNIDGEPLGHLPACFEIIPKVLPMVLPAHCAQDKAQYVPYSISGMA